MSEQVPTMVKQRQRTAPKRVDWTPTMEQRAGLEGRQVKCLIASEGHLWMQDYFDRLPPVIRHRLVESRFNICPACMDEDAHRAAAQRGERRPSISSYLAVIDLIERKLGETRP
jgi:hypothetical protein